jgi:hypothetical protein
MVQVDGQSILIVERIQISSAARIKRISEPF